MARKTARFGTLLWRGTHPKGSRAALQDVYVASPISASARNIKIKRRALAKHPNRGNARDHRSRTFLDAADRRWVLPIRIHAISAIASECDSEGTST